MVKCADEAEKQGRGMLGLDERHAGRDAKDPMAVALLWRKATPLVRGNTAYCNLPAYT